jgi:hypothetical protein
VVLLGGGHLDATLREETLLLLLLCCIHLPLLLPLAPRTGGLRFVLRTSRRQWITESSTGVATCSDAANRRGLGFGYAPDFVVQQVLISNLSLCWAEDCRQLPRVVPANQLLVVW